MRFFLALSCLQTRLMAEAWRDLLALEPDGIQLTPGCIPTPGFRALVQESGVPYSLHHGFAWAERKQDVWREGKRAVGAGERSVHPPQVSAGLTTTAWLQDAVLHSDLVYETMYPGYLLGSGGELRMAMEARLPLAVDISHLHIQTAQGQLSADDLNAVLEYDDIREIHVSHNEGRIDNHLPLVSETFLLEWARERGCAGTPVVLESYFHRLGDGERRRQVDLIRG